MSMADNTTRYHKVPIESLFDLEVGALYEFHNKSTNMEEWFLVVSVREINHTSKICRLLWDNGEICAWLAHHGDRWTMVDNVWKLVPTTPYGSHGSGVGSIR